MNTDRLALAAPWLCNNCGTRYKTELSRCQRCHSTDLSAEGNIVPKITRNNDLATMEGNPDMQPRNVRTADEGGEQSSVGTTYSTLSESRPKSEESSSPSQSLPAPTMESQFPLDQEASDTVSSAAGMTSEEEPRPRTGRKRSGF